MRRVHKEAKPSSHCDNVRGDENPVNEGALTICSGRKSLCRAGKRQVGHGVLLCGPSINQGAQSEFLAVQHFFVLRPQAVLRLVKIRCRMHRKGNASALHQFGVKVSIVTTNASAGAASSS
jgi:hypothetical protein